MQAKFDMWKFLKILRRFVFPFVWTVWRRGNKVGGDGLVIPYWAAVCWIAQGSGLESHCGDIFFAISLREEIINSIATRGLRPIALRCHMMSRGWSEQLHKDRVSWSGGCTNIQQQPLLIIE
jgi:hypothetical protein